jgi:hypothetical protein
MDYRKYSPKFTSKVFGLLLVEMLVGLAADIVRACNTADPKTNPGMLPYLLGVVESLTHK